MRFRIFGTQVYVSFLFFAVITVMLAFDRTGYCLPCLCAAAFHEIGHLFAMWISDCQPKAIRLVPASVSIISDFPRKKYGEFFIALSGPLFNIVLFCSLIINYRMTASEISFKYAVISLVIGLFNLLPVKGLDGGTILMLIIEKAAGSREKAEAVTKIITVIIGLLLLFVGAFLIIGGRINISIIIMGLYILICGFLR
ncbi:MAG: site-2 protease family protein [Clostridia bacterium]|nr:site-2 protease family protein [Clostridia bacterium]